MWSDAINSPRFDRIFRTGIRVVISGYFLATGMGLVPGTDLLALTGQFLPDVAAEAFAMAITLVLSAMILLGHRVRAAALTLAFLLFWSSYLSMIDLGLADQLGQFWRDLALAAALLLVCTRRAAATAPPVLFTKSRIHAPAVVGREIPLNTFRCKATRPAPPTDPDDDVTNIFAVPA